MRRRRASLSRFVSCILTALWLSAFSHISSTFRFIFLGDNNGDWVCDCRPAYVYYPLTNKCYRAYTQGPCNKNEILVLPKSKMIPICQRNECETGKVKYNGTCSVLESPDACTQPSKDRKTHRLYVDATTLQLQCTLLTNTRDPGVIDEESGLYESDHCFTGGRRSQNGNCRQSSAWCKTNFAFTVEFPRSMQRK